MHTHIHGQLHKHVQLKSAQHFLMSNWKSIHGYKKTESEREITVITSSPHSVTVTTLPVSSIMLRALLETSLLFLVVIRDTSSALLHIPITSRGRENHFTTPSLDNRKTISLQLGMKKSVM